MTGVTVKIPELASTTFWWPCFFTTVPAVNASKYQHFKEVLSIGVLNRSATVRYQKCEWSRIIQTMFCSRIASAAISQIWEAIWSNFQLISAAQRPTTLHFAEIPITAWLCYRYKFSGLKLHQIWLHKLFLRLRGNPKKFVGQPRNLHGRLMWDWKRLGGPIEGPPNLSLISWPLLIMAQSRLRSIESMLLVTLRS